MKILLKWLGLGLGCGLSPKAPGTVGSFLALLIALFFGKFVYTPYFLISSIILGVVISEIAEQELGNKDDGRIVIDEIVGQWIAVYSFSGYYLIPGFVLFRLFDILKPPPIRQMQRFRGGIGIMLDDIFAGFLTWLILSLVNRFLG